MSRATTRRNVLLGLGALSLAGCSHPAQRVLQGRWEGRRVENFNESDMAAATGWARGTTFEFQGARLSITLPAKSRRSGVYELTEIEDRTVTLTVVDGNGEQSELRLTVDDESSMRWMLDEGRAMVLERQP